MASKYYSMSISPSPLRCFPFLAPQIYCCFFAVKFNFSVRSWFRRDKRVFGGKSRFLQKKSVLVRKVSFGTKSTFLAEKLFMAGKVSFGYQDVL